MNLTEDNSGFIKKLFMRHVWTNAAAQVVSVVGPVVCGAIAGFAFGGTGLAIVGLFSPFFFLAGFFGTIVAGGSSTLAAKYIAQDDNSRVNGIYTLALILSTALAVILFALLMLLRDPLLTLLTGGGELLEQAALYYFPAVLYTCLTVVIFLPLSWARLTGRSAVALVLTLILTGATIAFATLYVFVSGRGIEWIAYAQLYGTALALVVSLAMLGMGRNGLSLSKPSHTRDDLTQLATLGSPLGLSRLYRFVSLLLLNIILLSAAGAEAVAVFSVLNMILRFVTAFSNGVSGVQMPIAGVLREERDAASLRQLAQVSFLFGNVVIIAAAVLTAVISYFVVTTLAAASQVYLFALICLCLYMPFYINGGLAISWYTAVHKVKLANIITLAQDMVLPLIFAWLFAAFFGGNTIWLHLPAAGILTLLLLFFTYRGGGKSDVDSGDAAGGTALAFSVERDASKAGQASEAVSDFCEEQGFAMKQAMLLSLAIEELIVLIAEQRPDGGEISVRLMRFEGGIVLRLRDTGRKFNPLDHFKESLTDDIEDSVGLMGIKYIIEAAEVVYYRETFGVNNLVVII